MRYAGCPIRVLLADDHPLIRAGIKSILGRHPNIRVVGEAAEGDEAVRLARALNPDIALVDINMPVLGGFGAAKALRKHLPSCRVIILSMHEDREYVRQAVAAGAKGYVQKDAAPDALRLAIETVHHGRTFFSDAAARALLSEVVTAGGSMTGGDAGVLTDREREVLIQVAGGDCNKEIAQKLGIGLRTIETHRARIIRKLGIHTAAGLTKFALTQGLIRL